MPKRSSNCIKTDRRDGHALARLRRAGDLTAIYILTADDEALRDLVRARVRVSVATASEPGEKVLGRVDRRSPGDPTAAESARHPRY